MLSYFGGYGRKSSFSNLNSLTKNSVPEINSEALKFFGMLPDHLYI